MEFKIIGASSSDSFPVNWIEAQTEQGNVVIMPGHVPMIILLAPDKELSMELTDGTTTIMKVAGGILEVTRTFVTLVLTHE